jgi:ribosomal protein S18 acetylase RimI-like enzyme
MEKTSSSKTVSSHSSQPSIRSFFQPKSQPQSESAASAPSSPATATTSKRTPLEGDKPTTDGCSTELQPTIKSPPPPIPPPLPTPSVLPIPQQQLRFKLPTLPPPPSLHPQANITSITASHIPALRRINSLLLQVVYPDSFYTNILNPAVSGLFSRVILWSDSPSSAPKVIGSLVIRTEDIPVSPSQDLYIQSITLLSPYRHLGLATAALEHVLSSAQLSSLSLDSGWDIRGIYAHVWTENHEGLEWYRNRGFKWNEGSPIKGYYHRLRPDTALIVRRDLRMAEQDGHSKGVQHTRKEIETRVKSSVLAGALNLPGFIPPPPTIEGAAPPRQEKEEEKDGPPPPSVRPSPPTRPQTVPSLSYQKTRPETEWNDLPEDMVISNGGPPKALPGPQHLSAPASGSSSRSTSAARKKKERAYPAAAFGGGK